MFHTNIEPQENYSLVFKLSHFLTAGERTKGSAPTSERLGYTNMISKDINLKKVLFESIFKRITVSVFCFMSFYGRLLPCITYNLIQISQEKFLKLNRQTV
jgi:hypothetical protein